MFVTDKFTLRNDEVIIKQSQYSEAKIQNLSKDTVALMGSTDGVSWSVIAQLDANQSTTTTTQHTYYKLLSNTPAEVYVLFTDAPSAPTPSTNTSNNSNSSNTASDASDDVSQCVQELKQRVSVLEAFADEHRLEGDNLKRVTKLIEKTLNDIHHEENTQDENSLALAEPLIDALVDEYKAFYSDWLIHEPFALPYSKPDSSRQNFGPYITPKFSFPEDLLPPHADLLSELGLNATLRQVLTHSPDPTNHTVNRDSLDMYASASSTWFGIRVEITNQSGSRSTSRFIPITQLHYHKVSHPQPQAENPDNNSYYGVWVADEYRGEIPKVNPLIDITWELHGNVSRTEDGGFVFADNKAYCTTNLPLEQDKDYLLTITHADNDFAAGIINTDDFEKLNSYTAPREFIGMDKGSFRQITYVIHLPKDERYTGDFVLSAHLARKMLNTSASESSPLLKIAQVTLQEL